MKSKIVAYLVLYKNYLFNKYSRQSYSQEGEDIIISRIFAGKNNGFYIDIGAHHPQRFSNTYLLYKKGWSGINIDATPNSMDAFRSLRSRDINLEMGVGNISKLKSMYLFNDTALNTFDITNVRRNIQVGYKLVNKKRIKLYKLEYILDKYAGTKQIDLLNIDVEGLDYEVLRSNNWDKYQPKVILLETFAYRLEDTINSKLYKLLNKHNYALVAKTLNTSIFEKQTSTKEFLIKNEYQKIKSYLNTLKKPKITKAEKISLIISHFITEGMYLKLKNLSWNWR